ncbi:hypothetical protein MCHI_000410 [Candidatus Magnetoovum chiemensis]|nr:hypothetical protein MCHI_000410 [Candidatus Magnetoovum chiemensis]
MEVSIMANIINDNLNDIVKLHLQPKDINEESNKYKSDLQGRVGTFDDRADIVDISDTAKNFANRITSSGVEDPDKSQEPKPQVNDKEHQNGEDTAAPSQTPDRMQRSINTIV